MHLNIKVITINLVKIIFDEQSQIIYARLDSRSASTLAESLRDLVNMCKKYEIAELFVTKNNKSVNLVNVIIENKDAIIAKNIKINILKDLVQVQDKETRQLILNDYHTLLTGGHVGVNRMYNNVKKNIAGQV